MANQGREKPDGTPSDGDPFHQGDLLEPREPVPEPDDPNEEEELDEDGKDNVPVHESDQDEEDFDEAVRE